MTPAFATTIRDAAHGHTLAAAAAKSSGFAIICTGWHRHNAALAPARFRLPNGLTMILLPDLRAPVFSYQSWFRVGSKHEDEDRTGLAHLFEHLMFKGTRTFPAGTFDREMERRGTQTNAATWLDWTYYTETLAARADNLETVVHFEVDRMTNLVIDTATFRSEVEVVKNERRQMVEDNPTGALHEELFATAFTRHPYRRPTIGAMEHLDATGVADLQRFYRTYYAPNNAVIVVAGAIEVEPTLTLLSRAYGPLAPQAVPRWSAAPEPRQEQERLAVLERDVLAPQLAIGFHVPAQIHPDYTALEMLNEILVVGDNARLYHRLVTEERVATDVIGSLAPFAEPGLYELLLILRPGVEYQRALLLVQEELDRLARGFSPNEMQKALCGLEVALCEANKDTEGCAEALGHFETCCGDFSLAYRGLELWKQLQERDLCRVAGELFCPSNRTVVCLRPPGD